jgi:hypothetical protein
VARRPILLRADKANEAVRGEGGCLALSITDNTAVLLSQERFVKYFCLRNDLLTLITVGRQLCEYLQRFVS